MDVKNITLVLIGKTGHGKSSTGNSLLFEKLPTDGEYFETSEDPESQTSDVKEGEVEIKSENKSTMTKVRVIDTPGLCDTGKKTEMEKLHEILKNMKGAMALASYDGVTCFLLVLKIGMRFTEEEISVLDTLKKIYTDETIRDKVIIIFTCKDNFEKTQKRKKVADRISFDDWVRQSNQPKELRDILEMCNNRCLAFDNIYDLDELTDLKECDGVVYDRFSQQRKQLLNMIETSGLMHGAFTLDDYERCCKDREMLLSETFYQSIRLEIEKKTTKLQKETEMIETNINRVYESIKVNKVEPDEQVCLELFHMVKSCQNDAERIITFLTKYEITTAEQKARYESICNIKETLKSIVQDFAQKSTCYLEAIEKEEKQARKFRKAEKARRIQEAKQAKEARKRQRLKEKERAKKQRNAEKVRKAREAKQARKAERAERARQIRAERRAREEEERRKKESSSSFWGVTSSLLFGLGLVGATVLTGGAAAAAAGAAAVGAAGTGGAMMASAKHGTANNGQFSDSESDTDSEIDISPDSESDSETYSSPDIQEEADEDDTLETMGQSKACSLKKEIQMIEQKVAWNNAATDFEKVKLLGRHDLVRLKGNEPVRGVSPGAIGKVQSYHKDGDKPTIIIVDFQYFEGFEAYPEELEILNKAVLG